ncbi:hypothetical protein K438DRAFT_1764205 [Mycena galopus ATCC 62051]|nr:hypothetical protein K438DRAFT_1764205 [Mycena galopus ATCC 62051]
MEGGRMNNCRQRFNGQESQTLATRPAGNQREERNAATGRDEVVFYPPHGDPAPVGELRRSETNNRGAARILLLYFQNLSGTTWPVAPRVNTIVLLRTPQELRTAAPVQKRVSCSAARSFRVQILIHSRSFPTAAKADGFSRDCGTPRLAVGRLGAKVKNSSSRGEEERMEMKPNGAIAPPNEQNLKNS